MKNTFILSLFFFCSGIVFSQEKNVFDIARNGSLAEIQNAHKKQPEIINLVDDRKSSPLIIACYRGNVEVAVYLIEHVKDLNYNSGMGTALMASVMSGNIQIIEKLIAAKVNLNQSDTHGKTALIYAVFFNKTDIAKLLIKAGSTINLKDNDSKTALDYANLNKNTELIILLDK